MTDQLTLPHHLLQPGARDEVDDLDRLDRAERRRQARAKAKATRLAMGKARPSAETLTLTLSGADRRAFHDAFDAAFSGAPAGQKPTRRDCAQVIFRLGLSTLTGMAEQAAKAEPLVQPASEAELREVVRATLAKAKAPTGLVP